MRETFTWAYPIETEKIRTHHAKIVVECTTGKPYYSIEWFDPAKQEYYLGYSSYNIENVLGWLAECFEIVEAPMTNADRIRAMSDEELAAFFAERDMILLRKALSVFESESLIPENAQDELLKDMLAALQQPAKEG